MDRRVKLNELRELCETLDYPTDRTAVDERLDGTMLVYADGEEPLSAVLERTGTGEFASTEELVTELLNVLPVEAVGEPGQSEGEG